MESQVWVKKCVTSGKKGKCMVLLHDLCHASYFPCYLLILSSCFYMALICLNDEIELMLIGATTYTGQCFCRETALLMLALDWLVAHCVQAIIHCCSWSQIQCTITSIQFLLVVHLFLICYQ